MKINFHAKGVIVTSKQKRGMERKILKMRRYVKGFSPITVDLTLLDESGPEKGGIDQAVHISMILPGEKIFIEEVDDRIIRAFGFAAKTLERKLKRFSRKHTQDRRREGSKFKNISNVMGAPIRAVGTAGRTAGRAVGRFVPKRKKK